MGVYRDLEAVPAALESAYQELKNPPDGKVEQRWRWTRKSAPGEPAAGILGAVTARG